MCNSKMQTSQGHGFFPVMQGRAVLQPKCNRVMAPPPPQRPLKKPLSPSPPPFTASATAASNKRSKDPNSLTSSSEKPLSPTSSTRAAAAAAAVVIRKKKSKNSAVVPAEGVLGGGDDDGGNRAAASLFDVRSPGSLATAQRELAAILQAQRKMKIAHYGRAGAKTQSKKVAAAPVLETAAAASSPSPALSAHYSTSPPNASVQEEKRCSFITPNSDPVYIAYHDEEWGVPVHDDKMLFELLVLSGAQVGLDWTTILKKRDDFRAAFCRFDVEAISGLSEKEMASISAKYGIELGRVRGVVDNSNRVIEVRKQFGSLDKYLWGFVNHRPIATDYRSCRKIPAKTSKSEAISRDMVRRGFRFVGPTVVHSFMQAAGLTNDHLTTCPRHAVCSTAAAVAAAAAAAAK